MIVVNNFLGILHKMLTYGEKILRSGNCFVTPEQETLFTMQKHIFNILEIYQTENSKFLKGGS